MILLMSYSLTQKPIHHHLLQEARIARVIVVHDFVCIIPPSSSTLKSPLEGTVTPRINTCLTIQRYTTLYIHL